MRDALKRRVRELLADTEFAGVTDLVLSEARECVYLLREETGLGSPAGGSRIGGKPDLPGEISWPEASSLHGTDLLADFLAQISLSDVPNFDGRALPVDGHLWIFIKSITAAGLVDAAVEYSRSDQFTQAIVPNARQAGLIELTGEMHLRFEVGISLPFGRTAFRDSVCRSEGQTLAWEMLHEATVPPDSVGQIGGFAYSFDGSDLRRDTALRELGHPEHVSPDQYDCISELEESMERVPAFVQTEEQLKIWLDSLEAMRPSTQWLERNQRELDQWSFLIRINNNIEVGFSVGDAYPLWIFRNSREVSNGEIGKIVTTSSP